MSLEWPGWGFIGNALVLFVCLLFTLGTAGPWATFTADVTITQFSFLSFQKGFFFPNARPQDATTSCSLWFDL